MPEKAQKARELVSKSVRFLGNNKIKSQANREKECYQNGVFHLWKTQKEYLTGKFAKNRGKVHKI